MKRVEDGDVLLIGDISYRVGETAALLINIWVGAWESGSEIDDTHAIHLWRRHDEEGDVIPASKVKAALLK